MPRHGKGFLDDLKSFGISTAKDVGRELIPIAKEYAISAAKSALTKKTAPAGSGLYDATNTIVRAIKGEGLYAARGSGYKLSPAQARALMAGKGVQLKKEMMGGEYEMKMTPAMEKKMMRAFAKGKGMRVGAHNLMEVKKGGFIIPLLTTAARIAAPILIEKAAEYGMNKLGGKKGGSKMGQEMNKILHGNHGAGLFAGGGMSDPDGVMSEVIQTGSPYQSTASPAMSPYMPSRNPYGMYNPL
jgi:hypothetical protein